MIGNREAIYKGSIYKFHTGKNVQGAQLTSLTEFSMSVLLLFSPHFVMRHDPCEPPVITRCVDECMCVRSRVSHVRIIKKSTLLPCATVCYISPCCAARVTRSADPGVNITRPPSPSRKKTMNLLKSLFLLLFQVYYSTIDPFLYSVSFVMNVN